MEEIITGTYLYNVTQLTEEKALFRAKKNISDVWSLFEYSNGGYVVAPSFGELSACYYQLTKDKIPVTKCLIGNLSESMIDRIYMMLETRPLVERVIYYFGEINQDKINKYLNVKNYSLSIIANNIIYSIIEQAQKHIEDSNEAMVEELIEQGKINYPVKCRIVPGCIFNQGGNSEIVIGLKVMAGKLKKNTIIYVNNKSSLVNLGKVLSLEKNNESVEEANVGDKIAVKLSNPDNKTFSRHFEERHIMFSFISRDIINNLKKYYRKKLSNKEWLLVRDLKEEFNVI